MEPKPEPANINADISCPGGPIGWVVTADERTRLGIRAVFRGTLSFAAGAWRLTNMSDITQRKDEHLDIVLRKDVAPRRAKTGFDHFDFVHNALPEIALSDVDVSTSFLGRAMSAPLLISSMTGGPERAGAINAAIAEASGALGIAFGVGSQRVALETRDNGGFGKDLRARAGKVPILANLGAAQLREDGGVGLAIRAVDMIEADAIIIHLNPLQEAVQHGGDTDWRGVLSALESLVRESPVPVVAKEVGAGLSPDVAARLFAAGVTVIDVAGSGGTSWAAVEAERAENAHQRAVANAFRDWGVPTARAVVEVRRACPEAVVIASGGIRDGIDAAKAIRIGADIVGQAGGVLKAALSGPEALAAHLQVAIDQLRIACFCTGSRNLEDLRSAPIITSDRLFEP